MADRESIILAAIGAAGPAGENKGAWYSRVRDLSGEIALMLDENSPLSKNVEKFQSIDARFVGVIVGGRVEASSKRAEVRFVPFRNGEYGDVEEIRTERTDTAEGHAMWELVKSLKGHRVLLHKRMEENNGRKFRVLQHVIDLGTDENAEDLIAKAKAAA